jgi:hypothetical protein
MGTISFAAWGDNGGQATTVGQGLSLSLNGLYYQKVSITFNTTYWNMGYVSEDTTGTST